LADELVGLSLKEFLTNWFNILPKLFLKGATFDYAAQDNLNLLLKAIDICYHLVCNTQSEYIIEPELLLLIGKLARSKRQTQGTFSLQLKSDTTRLQSK